MMTMFGRLEDATCTWQGVPGSEMQVAGFTSMRSESELAPSQTHAAPSAGVVLPVQASGSGGVIGSTQRRPARALHFWGSAPILAAALRRMRVTFFAMYR